MAISEARTRHLNSLKALLDDLSESIIQKTDIETVNMGTTKLAARMEVHISSLNNYGIFYTLEDQYESIEYKKQYGIFLNPEKYLEERKQEKSQSAESSS